MVSFTLLIFSFTPGQPGVNEIVCAPHCGGLNFFNSAFMSSDLLRHAVRPNSSNSDAIVGLSNIFSDCVGSVEPGHLIRNQLRTLEFLNNKDPAIGLLSPDDEGCRLTFGGAIFLVKS